MVVAPPPAFLLAAEQQRRRGPVALREPGEREAPKVAVVVDQRRAHHRGELEELGVEVEVAVHGVRAVHVLQAQVQALRPVAVRARLVPRDARVLGREPRHHRAQVDVGQQVEAPLVEPVDELLGQARALGDVAQQHEVLADLQAVPHDREPLRGAMVNCRIPRSTATSSESRTQCTFR